MEDKENMELVKNVYIKNGKPVFETENGLIECSGCFNSDNSASSPGSMLSSLGNLFTFSSPEEENLVNGYNNEPPKNDSIVTEDDFKNRLIERIEYSSKYNLPCPKWVYKVIQNFDFDGDDR